MTTEQSRDDEQRQLEHVRRELVDEFGDRLPPSELDARFGAIVREFDEAPVRTFVPVLARRRARQLLSAQG
jgi:hypothetical protein